MSKKETTYQSAYDELAEIVSKLESKNVAIDELSDLVSRAKSLVKFCQEKLRDVDKNLNE